MCQGCYNLFVSARKKGNNFNRKIFSLSLSSIFLPFSVNNFLSHCFLLLVLSFPDLTWWLDPTLKNLKSPASLNPLQLCLRPSMNYELTRIFAMNPTSKISNSFKTSLQKTKPKTHQPHHPAPQICLNPQNYPYMHLMALTPLNGYSRMNNFFKSMSWEKEIKELWLSRNFKPAWIRDHVWK